MQPLDKITVVFVHGLWADGSCWNQVAPTLLDRGYDVISVQNPLTSLEDDLAAVDRALARVDGPVIMVGHSWGGFVITAAGTDPRVKALVYVAALAPDVGQAGSELSEGFDPAPVFEHVRAIGADIWLTREAIPDFAGDVSPGDAANIYAAQGSANAALFGAKLPGEPAWKEKQSFYLLATEDRTIVPDQQRAMSRRIGAKVLEVASSHVAMISHPYAVLKLIEEAALHC